MLQEQAAQENNNKNKSTSETNDKNSMALIPNANTIEENMKTVATMNIVAEMDGTEFAKGEKDLVTQVTEFFDSINNTVKNEYGTHVLDRNGIKDSIGYGMGRNKAITYKAVPAVLEKVKSLIIR